MVFFFPFLFFVKSIETNSNYTLNKVPKCKIVCFLDGLFGKIYFRRDFLVRSKRNRRLFTVFKRNT